MTAVVLGSAAGGGYPQWNCCCPVCRLAWDGDARVHARTQASIAVSADGQRWILLNASPDLRAQLAATPQIQPRHLNGEVRDSPIAAVVLTGAEVDQIAGLLHLRERQPFTVYGTQATLGIVEDNSVFGVLAPNVVKRKPVALGEPFLVAGVEVELFTAPGKVPLYLESDDPQTAEESGANVGVELRAGGRRLVFVPGAASVTPALSARLEKADVVMFDGTLFTDDEMIRNGTGPKTGRRMGHMPIDGADGSLEALKGLSARRLYIHINNTNPILIDGSPERRRIEAAGLEVAEEGMEIAL
ncbi:MAG: pyrroloquinoline quinone biosynthesis protein PqqB [Pseudolabrys sp.]